MTHEWESQIPRLLLELGYFCLQSELFSPAQVLIEGAQALRPQDPVPSMLMGMVYFAQNQYTEAERAYQKALGQDPDHDLTKAFLAETLIAQKRYAEAEKLLSAVVERNRDADAVTFARELLSVLRQGVFQRAL
ncbi:MAG: tetratricopeptide repeat protein [Acidobacteria bacterium]|nr:tetratricopeptide repeat protein [Acidobacteriota bacterium]MDW7985156.1 tetratricopeptide repeat protein [Acidobacteriota bacterium]